MIVVRELKPGARRSQRREQAREHYATYMKSGAWYERRRQWEAGEKARLQQGNILCAGECGKEWTLADHLHHRTYDRLGNEAHEDLWAMCENCHYRLHEVLESRHWRKKPKQTAHMQALQAVQSENRGTAGNQQLAVDSLEQYL